MARRDAQKKGGIMAKEWWKSRSNEQTIEDLVAMGVLHNKALAGWRAPDQVNWAARRLSGGPNPSIRASPSLAVRV